MKTIISTAVGCLVASAAFATLPAGATTAATAFAAPDGSAVVITRDAPTPILLARGGADDPPGDMRRGRGKRRSRDHQAAGSGRPAGR